jgi:preprotein translocase subunit SecG
MTVVFFILIIIACVILGLVILIQNPKGGGLSGTLAGFNNQFMGVKQTTDTLEKGTWIFVSALIVLCLVSSLFLSSPAGNAETQLDDVNMSTPAQQQPANQKAAPIPVAPDSNK